MTVSSLKPEPFLIEPIFSPRIWGAKSLAPLFPEKTHLAEPLGEAWLTAVDCKIATGSFAGKTLGEAWREMPPEWRGMQFTEGGDFPILIKFIFPNEKLSIQVHPNDAYAAAHEAAAGGRGKTEMWHVILAEHGAHVLVGTKANVSKQQVLDAIGNDTLENLLESHPVYNGDTFFVPAGTPHTIGPGMILCEVQEYSDLTYRLYDYGRKDAKGKPRDLHVQKALEVMHLDKTVRGAVPPLTLYSGGHRKLGKRSLLCGCRYFSVERWEFSEEMGGTSLRRGFAFDILVVLRGRGQIGWSSSSQTPWNAGRSWGHVDFEPGQCWFVPACLSATPGNAAHATILRAYVPDLAALRSELNSEHHSQAEIAQTVFG